MPGIVEAEFAMQSEPTSVEAVHGETRAGDVRHSQADISRARELLGYAPSHTVHQGLAETCRWFLQERQE